MVKVVGVMVHKFIFKVYRVFYFDNKRKTLKSIVVNYLGTKLYTYF